MGGDSHFQFHHWAERKRAAVDQILLGLFEDAWPKRFQEACRYPLQTGGKRIRPLLCLAAAEAVGTEPHPALPSVAASIELIHTYSLVHDDLPAMDDDDERRGKPTVHKVFGEAGAILAGDALLTEAFSLLTRTGLDATLVVQLMQALGTAAGHPGMIGGQAQDCGMGGPVTDLDTLTRLHRGKTGALIACATTMGGLAAGGTPEEVERLRRFGEDVGLAFQLADDVLDEDQDAGNDGPPSFVGFMGVADTQQRATQLIDEATSHLETFTRPDALLALARYAIERDY